MSYKLTIYIGDIHLFTVVPTSVLRHTSVSSLVQGGDIWYDVIGIDSSVLEYWSISNVDPRYIGWRVTFHWTLQFNSFIQRVWLAFRVGTNSGKIYWFNITILMLLFVEASLTSLLSPNHVW